MHTSMQATILLAITCSLLLESVFCDVYLHSPRGSNNRLNEKSATRNNNNRLFNSQNNARGGYNVGDSTDQSANNEGQQYRMNYFQSGLTGDSELTIEWTAQHGCGGDEDTSPHKLNCNMVLQFMCQEDDEDNAAPDDSVTFRNGQNRETQEYSKPPNDDENEGQVERRRNGDVRNDRGLQESWEWYDNCYRRERNMGLFTADQALDSNNLGVSSAIFTRQSPNENRYGYECPEERDYYPYFHPTPWIDIAVLAHNDSSCSYYEQNSFNRRVYGECVEQFGSARKHWSNANNASLCAEIEGAEWVEYHSMLELAPAYTSRTACLRQNNVQNRVEYMWGKPYDVNKIVNHENIEDVCFVRPQPLDCKSADWSRVNHLGNGRDLTPSNYTWVLPYFPSENKKRCVFRMRYNISTDDYNPFNTDARHNQIKEDNFIRQRSPIEQNPLVNIGAHDQLLQLAINTDQTGRTFQDRSHAFFLSPRPTGIPQGARLLNLNVRGKRGNIVQVYPAVEYDFIPNRMTIGENDLVHFQWTGSNSHNNNAPGGDGATGSAGEGAAGTDRNNLVEILQPGDNYPRPYENTTLYQSLEIVWSSLGVYGSTTEQKQRDTGIQLASSGYFRCEFRDDCQRDSVEQKDRMSDVLNNAPASFSGFVARIKKGVYHYMCSRNNNFSNRSQKGMITVL